jgi:hypothetical protein
MTTLARAAVLALAFLCAACDEEDAVALRLRLEPDLRGTLVASALAEPGAPGEVASAATGVTFEREVVLRGAKGRFASLDGLAVADVTFRAGRGEGGLSWVRVELPTGAGARWPALFVPLDEAERRAAAEAFELTGGARDLGRTFQVSIELPEDVVSNGLKGKLRGTKNASDGRVATLVVPVQAAREGSEPLVWQITW